MQKIKTFLWYDTQAEEAARLYTSLFKNSKLGAITKYPENGPLPAGTTMTVEFELNGQHFTAMNAGPHFKFTEAISIHVEVDTQEEIDRLWNALTANGGEESMCGWLKDRYGLSWQIDPRFLRESVEKGGDVAARVFESMLSMKKIDIVTLQRAAEGK